jgi:hypothetical protein
VGSNPTLSAILEKGKGKSPKIARDFLPFYFYLFPWLGKVQEWFNWQHWKCCVRQRTVGSNPTLSAITTDIRCQRSEVRCQISDIRGQTECDNLITSGVLEDLPEA